MCGHALGVTTRIKRNVPETKQIELILQNLVRFYTPA